MVRNYKRKWLVPPPKEEDVRLAVTAVLSRGLTIRQAGSFYNVKRSTLGSYVKRFREGGAPPPTQPLMRTEHVRQVIPNALEIELAKYLKICSLMSHGLTPKETRCLAFRFAISNNLTVPVS